MTLIETAAKASHDYFRNKYTLLPPWDELPPEAHATAKASIRAIFEAIKTPTDAMLNAAWPESKAPIDRAVLWTKFVQAALNETE